MKKFEPVFAPKMIASHPSHQIFETIAICRAWIINKHMHFGVNMSDEQAEAELEFLDQLFHQVNKTKGV